jgi:hypothetical protein
MTTKTKQLLTALIPASLIASAPAALVMTAATADYTGGAVDDGGTTGSVSLIGAADNALGGTLEITATLAAADLTGTVPLIEIGGTSNGFGIVLIDGIPTVALKAGSGDGFTPASLNDLDMGTTNGTRPVASQISTIALLAGETYTFAASYNGANEIVFGVQSSTNALANTLTLTGQPNNAGNPNWSGNDTLTIGAYTDLGSTAPMSGQVTGTDLGAPWDIDDATPFAGTVVSGSYWNSVQPIVAVPEPSGIALVLVGLSSSILRRRR